MPSHSTHYARFMPIMPQALWKPSVRDWRKALLPEALKRWAGVTPLGSVVAPPRQVRFPLGGFVAILRFRVRSDFVGTRSLSISDTTSLLPASLLPPSSPAGLSFAACRDPATLEPSAILDRADALCMLHAWTARAARGAAYNYPARQTPIMPALCS